MYVMLLSCGATLLSLDDCRDSSEMDVLLCFEMCITENKNYILFPSVVVAHGTRNRFGILCQNAYFTCISVRGIVFPSVQVKKM